ncbi:hypothetical protein TNIN_220791, partial [Trichonephila inaurata madagascariensis]
FTGFLLYFHRRNPLFSTRSKRHLRISVPRTDQVQRSKSHHFQKPLKALLWLELHGAQLTNKVQKVIGSKKPAKKVTFWTDSRDVQKMDSGLLQPC